MDMRTVPHRARGPGQVPPGRPSDDPGPVGTIPLPDRGIDSLTAVGPVRPSPEPQTIETCVALRSHFDSSITALVSPVGRGLARLGVTPNTLTTLGLVLTAVGGGFVVAGQPVIGGWVLVFGGLMDTLDGAVARAGNNSTPFGAFFDSVSDRVSDGIILASVAFWLRDQPRLFALTITALVAAQVTSYVRAKAESIDLDCSIGILERAERAIMLMVALVFHQWLLEPVLWILAVGGVVTVAQRVHHVWCQVARDLPEDVMVLTAGDRAWNRAFKEAARRLYGPKNFDAAWEDMVADEPEGGPAGDGARGDGRAGNGRRGDDRPANGRRGDGRRGDDRRGVGTGGVANGAAGQQGDGQREGASQRRGRGGTSA